MHVKILETLGVMLPQSSTSVICWGNMEWCWI